MHGHIKRRDWLIEQQYIRLEHELTAREASGSSEKKIRRIDKRWMRNGGANKKRVPEDAPYLVLSKLVNSQTASSELLGSGALIPSFSWWSIANRSKFWLLGVEGRIGESASTRDIAVADEVIHQMAGAIPSHAADWQGNLQYQWSGVAARLLFLNCLAVTLVRSAEMRLAQATVFVTVAEICWGQSWAVLVGRYSHSISAPTPLAGAC